MHMPSAAAAAAAAKSLQSCPTLCDPIDGSPPGSPVPEILQARTLEWVAISFSNACKWKVKVKSLSRVQLLATPWTAAYQAPPSMGFSRKEYWSGLPLPSPHKPMMYTLSILFNERQRDLEVICPKVIQLRSGRAGIFITDWLAAMLFYFLYQLQRVFTQVYHLSAKKMHNVRVAS